ncbi:hypothetical protein Tco_0727795 [Tanacetum coccineum]|uniref:Uncharacterized protein n=1 Tax=Tanacetum coccineum TaxID=301880 RepID=A0ABQ4YJA4_9ASTR
MKIGGFFLRLFTKNCHLLTTRTLDDEVAPGLKAIRTFKVQNCHMLTTRTLDDEVARGLKAIRTFKVPDQNSGKTAAKKAAGPAVCEKADVPSQNKKVEPEDVDRAEMTLESRLGFLIQQDTITHLKSAALKEPLEDVMPAVLSVVEAECEKNPFEGEAAAPKKTVMASDSVSSVFGGGLDSLPREANSGKITPELLKGLECSDWKMRFESIEAVKIVEEANKRIQPTGTDIHGFALAIVLERLNSHGAFPEVHEKTRATGSGPTVKTTSKIGKSNGYGSKSETRAVSSRGVSAKGSKAVSIMSVQDISGPVGSRLAFTPTEPQRERHPMAQPSVIGPTYCIEATPKPYFHKINKNKRNTQSNGSNSNHIAKQLKSSSLKPSRKNSVSRLHSYPDHITPITRQIQAPSTIISGFNSTQKRFTLNMRKKSGLDENILKYIRAKERSREHMALLNRCGLILLAVYYLWLVVLLNAQSVQLQSVEGMKVCLAAKVLLKYRLLLLKYHLVMAWTLTILILLSEFIHSTLKKINCLVVQLLFLSDNNVEAKAFDFLAPTTRRNSMRTLAAARLLTTTRPTGQTQWGDSMGNNPMPAAHCAGAQLKVKCLTDTDQSLKATSKIEKSNGYGSKPESRAVSSRGVSEKGSKAESIMSVQDKFGPVGSRLAFTPTEPQRERHPMPQPSVIGPTNWNEATPTSVEGMKDICQEFKAISKDLEVHLVDDLITDADRLVSCLVAKVLQMYRLLLLKYLLVMAWRSTILILLLEFIHSTLKKGFNHVEAKGFEFLAPTTRRNSMRVLQAMQLKKPGLPRIGFGPLTTNSVSSPLIASLDGGNDINTLMGQRIVECYRCTWDVQRDEVEMFMVYIKMVNEGVEMPSFVYDMFNGDVRDVLSYTLECLTMIRDAIIVA